MVKANIWNNNVKRIIACLCRMFGYRDDVREKCREKYGDCFVEKYDEYLEGRFKGSLEDYANFLIRLGRVRDEIGI